ncbi:MAG: ATP-binding cassette domain-containing protein [Arcanobacterium sp.]
MSFSFPVGQFTSILGNSASSNSLLIDLLAGIEAPDAGTVEILGHQLADLSESQRAKLRLHDVGVIYGTHNAIEHLTMRQNMLLPYALNGKKSTKIFCTRLSIVVTSVTTSLSVRVRQIRKSINEWLSAGRFLKALALFWLTSQLAF